MKNLFIVAAAVLMLAACATHSGKSCCNGYHAEENMTAEQKEFDEAAFFDKNGCLSADMRSGYEQSELKCFDANGDGCISREEWDNYWIKTTAAAVKNPPEPGQVFTCY